MKTCTQCNQSKQLDQFHNDAKTSDGKRAKCKECTNLNRRKRFAKDPDHERAVNKKSRMKPENKIKHHQRTKQWRKQNPDYCRINPHIKELNKQLRRVKAIALMEARKVAKRKERNEYYKHIADKYNKPVEPLVLEWKDVKGYEGRYRISNYGDVYSLLSSKLLITFINDNGYCMVRLHNNDGGTLTRVHRIVGKHFVDNPMNKPYINHKDLDKTNNKANNLEWCDAYHNNIHYHALKHCVSNKKVL